MPVSGYCTMVTRRADNGQVPQAGGDKSYRHYIQSQRKSSKILTAILNTVSKYDFLKFLTIEILHFEY